MSTIEHKCIPRGFSLIELMIAVVIVGILSSIAYPSYVAFTTKSNRAEAQRELLRIANLQEQYFVDNRSYATSLKDIGFANKNFTTATKNYVITVLAGQTDAGKFKLRATAKNAQLANDTDCPRLFITDVGVKTPKACW